MPRPTAWFVLLECPKCGNKGGVLEAAYRGGWCIGPLGQRHRAINWKIVGRTEMTQ